MTFEEFVDINPKVALNKGEEYSFIPMEDVFPGNRYSKAIKAKIYNGGGAKFLNNDVIFARITPCLENGKIAQAINLKNGVGFGSTEFFVFRGKGGISDTSYIYYLSLTDIIKKTAEKSMSGASGRQRADVDSIKNIEFDFPDLPSQQKIASILSTYDDLIENNTRRIQILEQMAQTIYKEWFVNFRFPATADKPGYENTKFVDSPLGKIPEGWEVKRLDELVTTQYGFTASAEQEKVGPKFLRITDIVPSMIDWEKVPHCKIDTVDEHKYLLEEGDLVVARTGATVGYAKRINKFHPRTIFASYLVRLKSICKSDNIMIGLFVESPEYRELVIANVSGAAQPQANAKVLSSFNFINPSIELKNEFNRIVEPLLDQKEILQRRNRILRRTRDLLLPKLMSGEVEV